MKRIPIIWGIILLLLLSSITPISSSHKSSNNIIYVDDDGTADYTRIQDAIDNASDGDTIYVYSGEYYDFISENHACVYIDKSINLIGEDKHNTIIGNDEFGRAVIIRGSDNVTVRGFTIQNGGGIEIYSHKNIHISDNIIKNNRDGIDTNPNPVNNIVDINIYNNIIENNTNGIVCSRCVHIHNNIISDSAIGIDLYGENNDIYNNVIKNNEIGINTYRVKSTSVSYNNFINNENNVEMLKFAFIYELPMIFLFRISWHRNYWGDLTLNFKAIRGLGLIFVNIVIIFPIFEVFEVPIAIFPYYEFDWNPASEPYDNPIP